MGVLSSEWVDSALGVGSSLSAGCGDTGKGRGKVGGVYGLAGWAAFTGVAGFGFGMA